MQNPCMDALYFYKYVENSIMHVIIVLDTTFW